MVYYVHIAEREGGTDPVGLDHDAAPGGEERRWAANGGSKDREARPRRLW